MSCAADGVTMVGYEFEVTGPCKQEMKRKVSTGE